MWERSVPEPRLTAGWSTEVAGDDVPAPLREVAAALSGHYDVAFDRIWVNLYRDGRDSVAWHGDRNQHTHVNPLVATVSLGARRRFLLRPRGGRTAVELRPGHGDLVVMGGACQHEWEHTVPKEAGVAGPRMSITLRHSRAGCPEPGSPERVIDPGCPLSRHQCDHSETARGTCEPARPVRRRQPGAGRRPRPGARAAAGVDDLPARTRVGQGLRGPDHHHRRPAAAVRRRPGAASCRPRRSRRWTVRCAGSREGTEIARIKIWHNDKDLLYTADPHTISPRNPSTAASHELAEALEGEIEAEIISSSEEPDNAALLERYGTLLEVYVPILYDGDPDPAGVFELYLPYEPVQASIRADTARAVALLFGGLVVLWLGLFRTVATASRRLRDEADRNEHQALHDALTGLANRTLLDAELAAAVAARRARGGPGAARPGPVPRGQRHPGPRPRRRAGARDGRPAHGAGRPRRPGRPARRRRVRRAAAGRRRGGVGDGARRGAARRPARAGPGRRPRRRAGRPGRRVRAPGRRRRRAGSLLRHADVAAEHAKRTHPGLCVYDPDARRAQHRAARPARRPGPGAHGGRAGAALPAQVRPGRPRARRRGAGALAAPAARPARPR